MGPFLRLIGGVINNYTEITGAKLDCTEHIMTYGHLGN